MNTTNTSAALTAEQVMRARNSVRKYKKDVVVPEADLNEILELAAAAPSSWNLQQWRFLVVQEQAQKDLILPIAYGQQQVSDASAVIIVLGDLQANITGREIFEGAVAAGHMPKEVADSMIAQIDGAYSFEQVARDEANKNAAFAAMQLMLAAKAKGYDTVPMGGFDKEKLVQALNIPSRYIPVVMIALGEAAAPAHASARLPLSKLVINESF
ncbi:nitroreductase family protein [Paenibacillus sacheonensis]|uniref:Nitroreductase family protein n=1 Tax=Paenibacillus sacheonensis TaxID=742054 RepID=A0A7X5C0C5_9BACL|nr:nitroreductase family protein [Paenibacillus sacheonensis]MBM7566945.1 nitroreductase [Paenibacillus sacheonensis]NBC71567.1 nitroreductase family protein [Paenibacillus sacheonensis]